MAIRVRPPPVPSVCMVSSAAAIAEAKTRQRVET
jgi:hypothetical protein